MSSYLFRVVLGIPLVVLSWLPLRAAKCNYRRYKTHRFRLPLDSETILKELREQRPDRPPPLWPSLGSLETTKDGLLLAGSYARLAKENSRRAHTLAEILVWVGSAVFSSYLFLTVNKYWGDRYWVLNAFQGSIAGTFGAEFHAFVIVLPAFGGLLALLAGLTVHRYKVPLYNELEALYKRRASGILQTLKDSPGNGQTATPPDLLT